MSLATTDLAALIGSAFEDPTQLERAETQLAVEEVIDGLDRGELRLAEKSNAEWIVHPWVQQAILLYFRLRQVETWQVGHFEYHDKIPLKRGYERLGVRVVPPATARYGAFLSPGVVLMPSYVNIGAWVGPNTMVDTWATVGSGAQIGANVTLTSSTPIIDVTADEPITHRGRVPARSVVVPGTRARSFPAGEFQVSCALIVGQRTPSTDRKTSLNQVLRDFGVST